MDIKLFDSELKVMCVLWSEGDTTAKHISDVLKKEIGWNMNTTYTLIKRCIKKGAIERSEPNFMCHALIPKEEVQEAETNELIDKIYDGSVDKLFAALLGRKKLSAYARAVCHNTGSRTAASGYFIICFHVVCCMVCRNNNYYIVFRNILLALSD